MTPPDDVPSSADMFLKRKSGVARRPRKSEAAPGLFDALPAEALTVAVVESAVVEAPVAQARAAIARVWSVGDLVREVRGVVESRYERITVEGEISNWRPAGSGHCYFTLKDGAAQLSAVMFRREAGLVRFKPKDGDAVRLRGQVSVYESRGQMQLIAETMELAGIGAQLAAVQELKARLKREGFFENKRPLPAFPRCIGVVTSLQGAALRDIVKVCRRRHAAVNLLVYPAAVQGPRCAAEIAAGVRWFSARAASGSEAGRVDVVLVARGGGSWEDLHGFDDERVARAIAACAVPVIVGVGHATDTTIADAAADVCAPTPSAAAELVTAAQLGVEIRVERLHERARRAIGYDLLRARQRISRLSADAALRRMRDGLGRRSQRVDELEFRVQSALARLLKRRVETLARLDARLQQQNVKWRLAQSRQRLDALRGRIERIGPGMLAERSVDVGRLMERAQAMSPLKVLERGYALVYGPGGKLLRSATEVEEGEEIMARLAQGSLRARVVAGE